MSHSLADCAVIVFLRLPVRGKVKTRIASTSGEDKALEIYRHLQSVTFALVKELNVPVYLFYDGGLPPEADRNTSFTYQAQSEGNLGKKMADAFARVINHHRKAVIIGSDCPGLTTLIINDAFAVLETNDIVLGPANDGGYYLLGCKKVYPALFEGIAWSTPYVLGQTIEKIENENLSYRLLDHLTDIDTLQDWLRYKDQSNVTDGI